MLLPACKVGGVITERIYGLVILGFKEESLELSVHSALRVYVNYTFRSESLGWFPQISGWKNSSRSPLVGLSLSEYFMLNEISQP